MISAFIIQEKEMNCEEDDLWVRKIYEFLRFITSSNNKSVLHSISISQIHVASIWVVFSWFCPVEASDLDNEYDDTETRRRYKRALIVIIGYTAMAISFLVCVHLRRRMCRQQAEAASREHHDDDEYNATTTTATRKLEIRVMESFPEIVFPQAQGDVKFELSSSDCHICLEEFEEGEVLVVLPTCGHAYHKECIRRWMATANSCCPDCRHDYAFP